MHRVVKVGRTASLATVLLVVAVAVPIWALILTALIIGDAMVRRLTPLSHIMRLLVAGTSTRARRRRLRREGQPIEDAAGAPY